MKKHILAFALILLFLFALVSGCGSSPKSADVAYSSAGDAQRAEAPAAPQPQESKANMSLAGGAADGSAAASEGEYSVGGAQIQTDKIIYSARVEIETKDFDGALDAVDEMVNRFGAFLQSSTITGNNYYNRGGKEGRRAEFTIRVPRDRFREMLDSFSGLGNMPYCAMYSENITAQYTDTESRLKAYRIEEERLLAMLEKAETVEDMLNIEDRLAEVRYNIESLTRDLRGWDSLLSYSTITLQITEVAEYTELTPVQRSYWQQVVDALKESLEAVGRFFQWLFKFFVASLPVLVILAAIAAVVLLIRRRIRKKRGSPPPPRERDGGKQQ